MKLLQEHNTQFNAVEPPESTTTSENPSTISKQNDRDIKRFLKQQKKLEKLEKIEERKHSKAESDDLEQKQKLLQKQVESISKRPILKDEFKTKQNKKNKVPEKVIENN